MFILFIHVRTNFSLFEGCITCFLYARSFDKIAFLTDEVINKRTRLTI